ncbi:MAG TPA: transglycosylase SLT domain-containing protein [Kofleriaceae bacterium]|nr:transglycosylase SLT domain-containing protein [Kofleriaceae bacterium]
MRDIVDRLERFACPPPVVFRNRNGHRNGHGHRHRRRDRHRWRHAIIVNRSCAALVAAACLIAAAAPASARPSRAAKHLGEAYRALAEGHYARALAAAKKIDRKRLLNDDYADYVTGQAAFALGRYTTARKSFLAVTKMRASRFADGATWSVADCEWELGHHARAADRYRLLLRKKQPGGERAIAEYRIAEATAEAGKTADAISLLRAFRATYPAHPLAARAREKLIDLAGAAAIELSPADHLARAETLTDAHHWNEAIADLAQIADSEPADVVRHRDYLRAMTYYDMRRRYLEAGHMLLSLYKDMGELSAKALFKGARALSRADHDAEAITWYLRVVAEYPRSEWAPEASFLAGWLMFNIGRYRDALPVLDAMRARYGTSRWADNARWYLGLSHFLLGEYKEALPIFAAIKSRGGRLIGGKGHYWHARTLQKLGQKTEAMAAYRALCGRFPFSWYALLAAARLREAGIDIGPFGDNPPSPDNIRAIADKLDPKLLKTPLIRAVDELLAAGLEVAAGDELRRGERDFLHHHDLAKAMAVILDRYHRAKNYNRPWQLAVAWGGRRALSAPAKGNAAVWWRHAYPRAFRELVEKWQHLGDCPPYYIYTIMRKESGFDPHVVSFANARGLMQMIPRTTRRVARALGLTYTEDFLYNPELNIKTGAWYVGRLVKKFKGQIPLAAGAFNGGPGAVMGWADKNGDHPMDEFIELVSYDGTRGYMRKVTETYARYLYLYAGKIYEQPLTVDPAYLKNGINY